MSELEEVFTEELGFKLATSKDGISLFENPIDLNGISNQKLSLLSFSNLRGVFAASDSKSLIIDRIDKLNEEEPALFNTLLDLSQVSQLQFDLTGKYLYILMNDKLHQVKVDDFFSEAKISLLHDITSNVSHFQCSLNKPLIYYLDNESNLISLNQNDNSSNKIASNVSTFSFSLDGSSVLYSQGNSVHLSSDDSFKISPDDLVDDDSIISSIQQIDNRNWLVVYDISEDKNDLENHSVDSFVFEKQNGDFIPHQTFIADPMGIVPRKLSYYNQPLINWIPQNDLFFITSSMATELSCLSSSNNSITSIVQEVDSAKSTFPINDDGDDASVVGFAIDYISNKKNIVKNPCLGVDECQNSLPKAMVLTNEGNLVGWWIFDSKSIKEKSLDLNKVSQSLPASNNENESSAASKNNDTKSDDKKNPFSLNDNPFSSSKPSPFASFGKQPNIFGQSSTTSTDHGSNLFGSKSLLSDSTTSGPTNFSSKPNQLSSSGFGTSGFGLGKAAGGHFGSSLNNSNNSLPGGSSSSFAKFANSSPLSNLPKKESPFDKPDTDSPFAKLSANKESPFGQPSTDSPFSKLNDKKEAVFDKPSTGSPFAKFNEKKENPFGKPSTDSPFSKINENKENPFGKPSTDSSFAKFNEKKEDPFGRPSTDSPFAKFNDKNVGANAQSSIFDQPKTNKGNSIFPDLEDDLNEPSAQLGFMGDFVKSFNDSLNKSTEETKYTVEEPDSEKAYDESTSEYSDSELDTKLIELKQNTSNLASPSATSEPREASATSSLKNDLVNQKPRSTVPIESSASWLESRSVLGDSVSEDFNEYDSKALQNKEPRFEPTDDLNDYESKDVFNSGSRFESTKDSTPSEKEADLYDEFDDYRYVMQDEIDEENNYLERLSKDTIPELPYLYYFDGYTVPDANRPTTAPEIMSRLVRDTDAYIEVLDMNLEAVISFIDFHLDPASDYSKDLLGFPRLWRLQAAQFLADAVDESKSKLDHIKPLITTQLNDLVKIRNDIEVSLEYKSIIDKLFTQLKLYSTKSSTVNQKLLISQEILQNKLRTKYQNVEDQIKVATTKLFPMKAKSSIDIYPEESFKNLERVIYELNEKIIGTLQNINHLELQIADLDLAASSDLKDNALPKVADIPGPSKISKDIMTNKVCSRKLNFS